ncbi:MAG: PAS domain S-box protein [Candidatus Hermodarchaeota archaeon]
MASRDITAHKWAEEELEFRSFMLDHVMDSIFVTDTEGDLLYVNKSAYETRGYTKQELLNIPVYKLDKGVGTPERLKELINQSIETGNLIFESETINKDGSIMPVEVRLLPIEYREKYLILSVFRDITERMKAEETLRKSEEKFSKAFQSNPEMMAITTLSMKTSAQFFIEVNEAFEKISGYKKEEVLGKTVSELKIWWPEGEGAFNIRTLEELFLKEGYLRNIRLDLRSKSGTRLNMIVSAEKIELDDQEYLLWITRDITKLIKLQEEIIEKDKLAAVGQLAAGVAHELNTPLTNINLIAQLLLKMIETEKNFRNKASFTQDLQNIQKEVKFCGKIVKDLLQFSRKIDIDPTRFFVKSLVNELISSPSNASRFREKDIEVTLDIEGDLEATADRNLIVQIFQNIIDNSIDALDENKEAPKINITAVRKNKLVEITIQDNGKGLRKEDLPHVFEPFFTTKDAGKGTGLGLSICRVIIEKHKGTIKIESSVGKGTKIILSLPPEPGS